MLFAINNFNQLRSALKILYKGRFDAVARKLISDNTFLIPGSGDGVIAIIKAYPAAINYFVGLRFNTIEQLVVTLKAIEAFPNNIREVLTENRRLINEFSDLISIIEKCPDLTPIILHEFGYLVKSANHIGKVIELYPQCAKWLLTRKAHWIRTVSDSLEIIAVHPRIYPRGFSVLFQQYGNSINSFADLLKLIKAFPTEAETILREKIHLIETIEHVKWALKICPAIGSLLIPSKADLITYVEELVEIIKVYPQGAAILFELKSDLITDINHVINVIEVYPAAAPRLLETRAHLIQNGFHIAKMIKAYPECAAQFFPDNEAISTAAELAAILKVYPQEDTREYTRADLLHEYVDLILTGEDLATVIEAYPEAASSLLPTLSNLIESAFELARILKAFPAAVNDLIPAKVALITNFYELVHVLLAVDEVHSSVILQLKLDLIQNNLTLASVLEIRQVDAVALLAEKSGLIENEEQLAGVIEAYPNAAYLFSNLTDAQQDGFTENYLTEINFKYLWQHNLSCREKLKPYLYLVQDSAEQAKILTELVFPNAFKEKKLEEAKQLAEIKELNEAGQLAEVKGLDQAAHLAELKGLDEEEHLTEVKRSEATRAPTSSISSLVVYYQNIEQFYLRLFLGATTDTAWKPNANPSDLVFANYFMPLLDALSDMNSVEAHYLYGAILLQLIASDHSLTITDILINQIHRATTVLCNCVTNNDEKSKDIKNSAKHLLLDFELTLQMKGWHGKQIEDSRTKQALIAFYGPVQQILPGQFERLLPSDWQVHDEHGNLSQNPERSKIWQTLKGQYNPGVFGKTTRELMRDFSQHRFDSEVAQEAYDQQWGLVPTASAG